MPKPNRNAGPSMPRNMGPSMSRGMTGMRSPSVQPQGFRNDVTGALDRILGQMGTPGAAFNGGGGPRAYLPDSGPGGGAGGGGRRRRRRYQDTIQDPTLGPYFGNEQLNTYAPASNPQQFAEPDWKKKGLRGSKLDSQFGGMGAMGGSMGSMFGMQGAGGNPFSSGAGMMPGGMDFLSMLFPLLMSQMGQGGPQVGR